MRYACFEWFRKITGGCTFCIPWHLSWLATQFYYNTIHIFDNLAALRDELLYYAPNFVFSYNKWVEIFKFTNFLVVNLCSHKRWAPNRGYKVSASTSASYLPKTLKTCIVKCLFVCVNTLYWSLIHVMLKY